jgi:hypothetical protein
MKWFSTLRLIFLTSCAEMMPGLVKAVEDIETDTAIKVEVDKEALQKDTDIHIMVDVVNKDQTPAKP